MTGDVDGADHANEPHDGSMAGRLNWLRAGVLGANDGIISTAGLVIGVAAATTSTSAIATAGIAGLTAGAVSMALGDYVSVGLAASLAAGDRSTVVVDVDEVTPAVAARLGYRLEPTVLDGGDEGLIPRCGSSRPWRDGRWAGW